MSAFRDMVAADNVNVFLNLEELAETVTVKISGTAYEDITAVFTGVELGKLQKRGAGASMFDNSIKHVQNMYSASFSMYCSAEDVGGDTPKKGARIVIIRDGKYNEYYVAESVIEIGMLRIDLEAVDE